MKDFGYDPETGLWFFGDCAFGPEGELILPGADGAFHWQGQAYRVA